jgi:hypothetical protein
VPITQLQGESLTCILDSRPLPQQNTITRKRKRKKRRERERGKKKKKKKRGKGKPGLDVHSVAMKPQGPPLCPSGTESPTLVASLIFILLRRLLVLLEQSPVQPSAMPLCPQEIAMVSSPH